ncbi:MAG TPA: type VI secretion system baseplate subunit TssF, partial [Verrucomicrobiae bacterium]|nr:type VI secretion system baseplate subunit TssF [Verrucomicrobiae bacterium]
LNYLSIVEGGREALQEILRLYDFTGDAATLRQIEGLTDISSRRGMARVLSEYGVNFCQGLQIAAEFDEEQYVGREVFLFACVLERFLALYSSINSFSQLTVRTRQRKGILKRWPPRSGEQILL